MAGNNPEHTGKGGAAEPTGHRPSPAVLAVLLTLIGAAVLAVHWPALSAEVLSFDDSDYLTENILVQNPGWNSARRFLGEVLAPSTVGGYYQPLAMISLMLDYAAGGRADNLQPFHRTSLALHVMNTMLVVVLLHLLFRHIWVAALVGLLFGVHPLTIEAIPWVGERKTLLAAFFALWSLIFYVRYGQTGKCKLFALCLITYLLALMSKPTSTPLPLLMLLLDYWPLKRLNKRAILEKLPLLALAAAAALVTVISQGRTASVTMPDQYGPVRIVLILCHNIIFYLYKIVWPVNLTSHYPFPDPLDLSDGMILAGVIGTCLLLPLLLLSWRRTPALIIGWLFFFVAIFPTMGVIGFTIVIASDKFAYLPSVGLLITLTYLLAVLWRRWAVPSGVSPRCLALVLVLLLAAGFETCATRGQLARWQDTETYLRHMLRWAPKAALIHDMLGSELRHQGQLDAAIEEYQIALQLNPRYYKTYNNLGNVLTAKGNLNEALEHYRQSRRLKQNYQPALTNEARVLAQKDRFDEAVALYKKAIEIRPSDPKSHYNLAITLSATGRLDEAIYHYQQALRFKPEYPQAYNNLGLAWAKQDRLDKAIDCWRETLRISPTHHGAHNNLGLALAQQGKLHQAIEHYRCALNIDPDYYPAHHNLASALDDQGKIKEAVTHYHNAVRLKPDLLTAMKRLAWILATHRDPTIRNPAQALPLAQRAAELTSYRQITALDTLAAAYAALGRFEEAVATAENAIELARKTGKDQREQQIRRRLSLYRQKKPYLQAYPPPDL